jgi:hypothetical protein
MTASHTLTAASLSALLLLPFSIQAELVDGSWLVRPGDSVYKIARQMFPGDSKQQARFRSELVNANPDVFQGNASSMSVGSRLSLPAYAVPKTQLETPAARPQPPARQPSPAPAPTVEPARQATADPEDIIGKVIINLGELQAVNRGSRRPLERNSNILKGDVIITADDTHSQIRLKDGALFSLRPNTQMRIAQYEYNGRQDGSERSLIELIKGGFRTITGAIGHRNKQNYRVQTSVATIGIRGTHYGLMLCQAGSCQNNNGMEDGLYGGVLDGSVMIENQSGIHRFNNDQFFRVADVNLPPVEVLVPPPVLGAEAGPQQRPLKHQRQQADALQAPAEQGQAGEQRPPLLARAGQMNLPQGPRPMRMAPIIDPLPPLLNTRSEPLPRDFQQLDVIQTAIYDAPFGASMNIAFMEAPGGSSTNPFIGAPVIVGPNGGIKLATLNGIGNQPIAGYETSFDIELNQIVRHQFAIGDPASGVFALPSNIGGDPNLGVNWGRWQGQARIDTVADGQVIPIVHTGDVHFIYSPNVTSLTRLANLGGLGANVIYNNVVGGTAPTDHLGNVGAMPPDASISIAINANFLTQTVDNYDLSVSVGGLNYSNMINDFNGDDIADRIAFNQLNQSFRLSQEFTGTCGGGKCTGEASVVFVGPAAEGAITSYSVGEPDGSAGISGTALILR